ncbi:MAG: hypothetical protein AAF799_29305 [Myxococcota bacterium]
MLGLIATMALSSPRSEVPRRAGVALRWVAPPGCPNEGQVDGWLEALTLDAPPTIAVRAEITVEARDDGFASRLVLDAGPASSTRELWAPECELLARANMVVVAVGLDPLTTAEAIAEQESEAEQEPTTVPEPAVRRRPRRPAPVEPPRPEPPGTPPKTKAERKRSVAPGLEFGVRLGAGPGGLVLPGAGFGGVLSPWLGTERIQVRAAVQAWSGRRVSFDAQQDAAGVVRLVSGGVRVCPVLGRGRLRVPLCAGVDGGAVLGQGTGNALIEARSAVAPWAGAVLQPGLEYAMVERISLWAGLEGVISLYRPAFSVDGVQGQWTAGAGGLRGLVGLEIHRARKIP